MIWSKVFMKIIIILHYHYNWSQISQNESHFSPFIFWGSFSVSLVVSTLCDRATHSSVEAKRSPAKLVATSPSFNSWLCFPGQNVIHPPPELSLFFFNPIHTDTCMHAHTLSQPEKQVAFGPDSNSSPSHLITTRSHLKQSAAILWAVAEKLKIWVHNILPVMIEILSKLSHPWWIDYPKLLIILIISGSIVQWMQWGTVHWEVEKGWYFK